MLTRLLVKNYVLIDSLEIEFPEGLIIITGQTGAGKSIILGALSLLMGGKGDQSMIAENAETCVVEAEFDIKDDYISEVLAENEIDEDGPLVIRRVLNKTGRSRTFINDCPVAVSVLQSISASLVDIHSQHQTSLLSDARFQLSVLDHFAGNMQLREKCAAKYRSLLSTERELEQINARLMQMDRERDYNQAQWSQLDSAALVEGELEELEAEQQRLANAEEIKLNLSSSEGLYEGSDDNRSMDSSLKEISRNLAKIATYIPQTEALSERVDSARLELNDIFAEISDINEKTELSSSRLEEVDNRLSLLYSLLKKHGCTSVAELITIRDNYSQLLFDSTALQEQKEALLTNISSLKTELAEVADELSHNRHLSAGKFAESITGSLHFLELQNASFEVLLKECPISLTGKDEAVFMFSATGRNLVEMSRCASGGELSRIMLALKSMMAQFTNMPTMIFDEIDTGVSGSVADKMGSMICNMGASMQVFAITHLPQVAAKGKAHYLVSKEFDSSAHSAVTSISRLDEQQRIMEIARMLSGSNMTDAAIENAKSLLNS